MNASSPGRTPEHKLSSLPLPVQTANSPRPGSKRHSVRFGSKWGRFWHNFMQQFGPGTAPSSIETSSKWKSSKGPTSRVEPGSVVEERVVVDRLWTTEVDYDTEPSSIDEDALPDHSGATPPKKPPHRDPEFAVFSGGILNNIWFFFRWRLFTACSDFFYPKSHTTEEAESSYRKEDWFVRKPLARWAAAWLICNWVLGIGFLNKPWQLIDLIFYFGLAPGLSFPVIFLVLYNWPRDHPIVYQLTLVCSVWMWPFYQVLFIYLCGLYNTAHSFFDCNNRDFLPIFFYTTALQTIALFGLKMDRFPAAIGATLFFVVSCVLVIPDRISWVRSMLNFAVYHTFLLYVHYARENAERRMHNLRLQVKMQYRATQRAQVNERKMSDSKYRLTSYVFHEVRVPLNAAVLAVQNMAASGTIVKEMEIEFDALKGSLETMSKVLNDVLDFNRIDSGHFESVSKPFQFHQTFTTLFHSLNISAAHKGLHFDMDLDPRIDEAARRASYRALGLSGDAIARHMSEHPNVTGVVVGDEARLRQIVSNLTTNAIKFTESGGSVRISTVLVSGLSPNEQSSDVPDSDPVVSIPAAPKHKHALSESNLSVHNREHENVTPSIIARIVVSDSGCGIDVNESRKLFSPFHQTDIGKAQGGSGTGLGLSLVRSIVKLLGGRLGFSSHKGMGSTFWVELPFGVGGETLIPPQSVDEDSDDSSNDIRKVRAAARHMATLPAGVPKDSLLKTVDAAALDASASWTSIPVRTNMLQQVVSMSDVVTAQSSNEIPKAPTTPNECQKASQSSSPTFASRLREQESSAASTLQKVTIPSPPIRRPTSVSIPSTLSFAPDPNPSTSTDMSQNSNKMALFDRAFSVKSAAVSDTSEETPSGLSVLVVDDDTITRAMMERMLKRLGCDVTTAENGKIAVQLMMGPEVNTPSSENTTGSGVRLSGAILTQQSDRGSFSSDSVRKFNVTFMDNQMPVMSGLQAIKFLRSQGRKDFVVGLTGNALLPDQNEYVEAGVDIVLTKPVLERQLKDVLRQADTRRKRGSRRHTQDHPP